MPAKSKAQQRFFGVVKSMQQGDTPKKGEAGKAAKSMSKKEVEKYASTKHKGLPDKVKEDIDIGHKDDEPGMLKADLYQIAVYAADLYKIVDELGKRGDEIDFPHWWQAKVIKSKGYLSAAKHYLRNELATNPNALAENHVDLELPEVLKEIILAKMQKNTNK
jgi:hypothetical protein